MLCFFVLFLIKKALQWLFTIKKINDIPFVFACDNDAFFLSCKKNLRKNVHPDEKIDGDQQLVIGESEFIKKLTLVYETKCRPYVYVDENCFFFSFSK